MFYCKTFRTFSSFSMRLIYFRYLVLSLIMFSFNACQEPKISFNDEIRPIFNKHCVSCHGGVKRSAGFGLVFRENALKETDSGNMGIVPGKPQQSELYRRLVHSDPEMRMPFEEDPLTEEQIELVRKWIAQGAVWEDHWAYLPPKLPDLPKLESNWGNNEIDLFVLEKIEENGLSPSPEAEPAKLIRRLFLDLVGLPPTPEEVEAFSQKPTATAYENLVDELLASPHFGENWASMWLDLARYADSFGYSSDVNRIIWKYRDWVISSLNEDMPFDRFTIEQLAGDLLPEPDIDQMIATAFHRNSMTNGEGGAFHEEYRNAAIIDRVNTTWETWQATTMGCVQCHNHPYDPIKQTDFYSAFAFFNNTTDRNLIAEFPVLKTLEEVDQDRLDAVVEWLNKYGTEDQARQLEKQVLIHEPKIGPADFEETHQVKFLNRIGDDYMSVYDSSYIKIADVDLEKVDKVYLHHLYYKAEVGTVEIRLDHPHGLLIGEGTLNKTRGLEMLPVLLHSESRRGDLYLTFHGPQNGFEVRIDGVLLASKIPGSEAVGFAEIRAEVDALMNARAKVTTPVMVEKQSKFTRITQVFERGSWLQKGEEVRATVPEILNPDQMVYENRLDLAKWLVSGDNPLTARVLVNRIWARFFGRGIVATVEDFGTMGDLPSHPELLDWLAIQFSEQQAWHLKQLIRSIVLSATYQQSARTTREHLEKDPTNLWLARSPRLRLSAEQIRDQALAVSGLLSKKMYGPSVMPPQPEGIWKVSFSNAKWTTSEKEDRYRRALYTFIKRSAPYPSFIAFDAAEREVCLSRRIITNTPLQALVTLNDPVFFDAARALAAKVMELTPSTDQQLVEVYTKIMGVRPSTEKKAVIKALYRETRKYYESNPEEAHAITKAKDLELTVLTIVANGLMNMDEFLVKS